MDFNPDAYLAQKTLSTDSGFNPDAYLAQKNQQPQENLSAGDVIGGMVKNAIPSLGRVIGGVAQSVLHPIDTVENLGKLVVGAGEAGAGKIASMINPELTAPPSDREQLAGQVGDFYKNRYSSIENLKRALANDPAGVAMDAASVLTGAGAVSGKLGALGSAIDPLANTARAIGAVGKAILPTASAPVVNLAERAAQLGIDVPADRLVNSPALNAAAATLRYVPFSGRAGTEATMEGQIKQALSRTIGEDTPDLTVEMMRNAKARLGEGFDTTLKNNNVVIDEQLQHDLYKNLQNAKNEMGDDARLDSLRRQVSNLLGKAYVKDPMGGEGISLADMNAGRPTYPDFNMAGGAEALPIQSRILSEIKARGGLNTSEMRDLLGENKTNRSGATVGAFTKNGQELGDMAEQLVAEKVLPPSILEGNGGARNLGELIQKELNPEFDKNAAAYQAHLDEAPILPGAYKEGETASARPIDFEQSDQIGGKSAYDTKKVLDRLGNSADTSLAFHAKEVRRSLMQALNRSLGEEEAAKFSTLQHQYGNLKELTPLIQNGAEGGVSMARLANMKGINNPELQQLVHIAAQFAKGRESPHGAMQRVAMGTLGAGAIGGGAATGMLAPIAAGLTVGRGANMLLNSQFLKDRMLGRAVPINTLTDIVNPRIAAELAYQANQPKK